MRIGFDANPMVGDMGGVGWHSYHLLRTMLAQQEGIDFVAYARPGAEQPDSVRSVAGRRATSVDELEPMGDGEAGFIRSVGSLPWNQFQNADRRALWRGRHDSRSVAGSSSRVLEEDVGPMAVVVQDETNRVASQKSHHGVRVFRERTRWNSMG